MPTSSRAGAVDSMGWLNGKNVTFSFHFPAPLTTQAGSVGWGAEGGIAPDTHVGVRTVQCTRLVPWGCGPMWASAPTLTSECVPFNAPAGSVGLRVRVGIGPYPRLAESNASAKFNFSQRTRRRG